MTTALSQHRTPISKIDISNQTDAALVVRWVTDLPRVVMVTEAAETKRR